MHTTQAIDYVTLMVMVFLGRYTVLCGKCVSLKISSPSSKLYGVTAHTIHLCDNFKFHLYWQSRTA